MRTRLKRFAARFIKTKAVNYRGFIIQGAFEDFGFLKALGKGRRETYMVELFLCRLKAGMTIVDIGAHLGQYTLLAASRVGPNGQVFAFEPHPRTFRFLQSNIERNGLISVVSAFPLAISDRSGEVVLHADLIQSDFTSLTQVRDISDTEAVRIQMTRLDTIHEDLCLDIVKVDVEGAELLVLDGMHESLRKSRERGKAPVLFIESNSEALKRSGASPEEMKSVLLQSGFSSVKVICEETKSLEDYEGRFLEGCYNLICE